MNLNIRRWPQTTIIGLFVIVFYCTFTAVSWALYTAPYGPVTHYLSRLGNFDYNPIGAYFYNIGCILTGLALIPFFLSLRPWFTNRKAQVFLLMSGQLFGVLSACALVMIGVFSEDQGTPHMTASSTFFLLNFIVLILINVALLWNTQFIKPIALYGLSINILSLAFELSIGGPIVEWFTVFGSLIFVALISMNSLRISDETE